MKEAKFGPPLFPFFYEGGEGGSSTASPLNI